MRTLAAPERDMRVPGENVTPWRPALGERVVLYGGGAFARSLLTVLRNAGANVLFALDRRGGTVPGLDDLRVHAPGSEPISHDERRSCTAVVGVFNRDADVERIEELLRSLGYGRVVGVPELYESLGAALGERFWLAGRDFYAAHRERIEAAADVWADAASRDLFRSLLRFRVDWDSSAAPRPADGAQYFPVDVPAGESPVSFVDCGAFDGDTLATLADLGRSVEQVYAFEPDLRHFARLSVRAAEFARATGAHVSLWPCAVAATSQTTWFRSDSGEAGRLSADGDVPVTTLALDEALPSAVPTDVKMDVEGAELDALRGAERLIRRAVPRLAICVYHRPEHLWEIPLFVRGMGLPYELFLRSHGYLGFDTVMYAVPLNRPPRSTQGVIR
jgi:FkbM family methyltransferase